MGIIQFKKSMSAVFGKFLFLLLYVKCLCIMYVVMSNCKMILFFRRSSI